MTVKHPGKRICEVIKLKSEFAEEYFKIHANPPPQVLERMSHYHIEDYSIHYFESESLLIANFKYMGSDWATDSESMRLDPVNHEWWAKTDQMQQTLQKKSTGSTDKRGWWFGLPEVFRYDG